MADEPEGASQEVDEGGDRRVPGGVGSLKILWAQRQLLTILLLLLLALAAVAFACDIKVIGSN